MRSPLELPRFIAFTLALVLCTAHLSLAVSQWTTHKTADGSVYYFNKQTGVTQWNKPAELAGPTEDKRMFSLDNQDKLSGNNYERDDSQAYKEYNRRDTSESSSTLSDTIEKGKSMFGSLKNSITLLGKSMKKRVGDLSDQVRSSRLFSDRDKNQGFGQSAAESRPLYQGQQAEQQRPTEYGYNHAGSDARGVRHPSEADHPQFEQRGDGSELRSRKPLGPAPHGSREERDLNFNLKGDGRVPRVDVSHPSASSDGRVLDRDDDEEEDIYRNDDDSTSTFDRPSSYSEELSHEERTSRARSALPHLTSTMTSPQSGYGSAAAASGRADIPAGRGREPGQGSRGVQSSAAQVPTAQHRDSSLRRAQVPEVDLQRRPASKPPQSADLKTYDQDSSYFSSDATRRENVEQFQQKKNGNDNRYSVKSLSNQVDPNLWGDNDDGSFSKDATVLDDADRRRRFSITEIPLHILAELLAYAKGLFAGLIPLLLRIAFASLGVVLTAAPTQIVLILLLKVFQDIMTSLAIGFAAVSTRHFAHIFDSSAAVGDGAATAAAAAASTVLGSSKLRPTADSLLEDLVDDDVSGDIDAATSTGFVGINLNGDGDVEGSTGFLGNEINRLLSKLPDELSDRLKILSKWSPPVEKFVVDALTRTREILSAVLKHPPAAALLAVLLLSSLVCGVLLPILRQSAASSLLPSFKSSSTNVPDPRNVAQQKKEQPAAAEYRPPTVDRESKPRKKNVLLSLWSRITGAEDDDDEYYGGFYDNLDDSDAIFSSSRALSSMGSSRSSSAPPAAAATATTHRDDESASRELLSALNEKSVAKGEAAAASSTDAVKSITSPAQLIESMISATLSSAWLLLLAAAVEVFIADDSARSSLFALFISSWAATVVELYLGAPKLVRRVSPSESDADRDSHEIEQLTEELSYLGHLNDMIHGKEAADEVHRWGFSKHIRKLRSEEIKRLTHRRGATTAGRAAARATSSVPRSSLFPEKIGFLGLARQVILTGIIAVLTARAGTDILLAVTTKAGAGGQLFRNVFENGCAAWLADTSVEDDNAGSGFSPRAAVCHGVAAVLALCKSILSFFLESAHAGGFHAAICGNGKGTTGASADACMDQSVLVLGVLASPLLLWMRFLSSARIAASAVGDITRDPALSDLLLPAAAGASGSTRRRDDDEDDDDDFIMGNQGDGDADDSAMVDKKWWDDDVGGADSGGWTVDGPDKPSGIRLQHVNAVVNGREILKDVSIHFPTGAITTIIGSATSGPSELLSLLWGQGSKSRLRLQGGKLLIQGREAKEWKLSALRSRITYLRDNEAELNLPAGVLAGSPPDDNSDSRHNDRYQRALDASGARPVIASLIQGADTVLGGPTSPALTSSQWRSLALSRALSQIDRDIILLDNPCEGLTEIQEARFFRALRTELQVARAAGKHKVVVVTSSRFSSATHADKVVIMAGGRVIQEGPYKLLIDRPGPLKDVLGRTAPQPPQVQAHGPPAGALPQQEQAHRQNQERIPTQAEVNGFQPAAQPMSTRAQSKPFQPAFSRSAPSPQSQQPQATQQPPSTTKKEIIAPQTSGPEFSEWGATVQEFTSQQTSASQHVQKQQTSAVPQQQSTTSQSQTRGASSSDVAPAAASATVSVHTVNAPRDDTTSSGSANKSSEKEVVAERNPQEGHRSAFAPQMPSQLSPPTQMQQQQQHHHQGHHPIQNLPPKPAQPPAPPAAAASASASASADKPTIKTTAPEPAAESKGSIVTGTNNAIAPSTTAGVEVTPVPTPPTPTTTSSAGAATISPPAPLPPGPRPPTTTGTSPAGFPPLPPGPTQQAPGAVGASSAPTSTTNVSKGASPAGATKASTAAPPRRFPRHISKSAGTGNAPPPGKTAPAPSDVPRDQYRK